jgi:serine/threonine-protein kinase
VNPARIFLRPDGTVRLTGFALARSLLPGRVATSLPRPQGDAYYGAPEALLGEPMDARSDLFALGLVLLEAVTCKGLYSISRLRRSDLEAALTPGMRPKVMAAHATATLAELPGHVEDSIRRAATYTAPAQGSRRLACTGLQLLVARRGHRALEEVGSSGRWRAAPSSGE